MATDPAAALKATIASLEAQRAVLGDAVVDGVLAPLREQLAKLLAAAGPARTEAGAPGQEARPAAAALPQQQQQLPQHQPQQQQLRLVSVLFLDMVGSTQLVGQLDPEAAQSVLDGALQSLSEVVRQHGGEVLQYAGDNLMAAFGAAGTREDDAERAVRCGLALLERGQQLSREVREHHGLAGFGVRVGIHTGSVLRGGGVDGDNSLRGQAVHIAARMEQSAPPGGLRISQDTWSLVRGLFDAKAQEPMAVKGVAQPLRTWLVEGLKPRHLRLRPRGIEGRDTPLVGRATEMAALLVAFEAMAADGQARAITLVADPGIGKSRLLHEFQHQLADHARTAWLMLARLQPANRLQPYGLLRELVAWRMGIVDSDDAETARRKLVEGLAPWLNQPDDPPAQALGQLIGFDFSTDPSLHGLRNDARWLHDRALAALGLWWQRLAERDDSVVVLLLDDLQWADDASLDALLALLKVARGRLLAIIGARPLLLERRTDWAERLPRHRLLRLAALDTAARGQLTQALLHHMAEVPPALAELIEHQAEGNPFYAEEIVRMLIDDGAIITAHAGWRCDAHKLAAARVPPTLTGVLQARIDALAEAERSALFAAAIVGPVFWDSAVHALSANSDTSLPALQGRGMVQLRPTSAFADSAEESFHHHLLHQVSYDAVLPSVRRAGHARVAAWLAERVAERAAEYRAVTAEHYERAGDLPRAFAWWYQAMDEATDRFANSLALQYADRALRLRFEQPARERARVQRLRAQAADVIGDRQTQTEALDELLRLAELLDNDELRASALSNQALLADRLNDPVRAGELAKAAVLVAERCGSARQAALSWGELAWLDIQSRNFESAEINLQKGLHWARLAAQAMLKRQDFIYEVQLLLVAAELYRHTHNMPALMRVLSEASAKCDAGGNARTSALCASSLAETALLLADFDGVRRHCERSRALADGIELSMQSATSRYLLAWALHREGDAAAARRWALDSVPYYERGGDVVKALRARALAATALADMGELAAAEAEWQALLPLLDKPNHEANALAARLHLAELAARQGRLAQAVAAIEAEGPRLADPEALVPCSWPIATRMAVHRALALAGHPQAPVHLELAHQALMEHVRHFDEADRERVLTRVVLHREVLQQWQAWQQR